MLGQDLPREGAFISQGTKVLSVAPVSHRCLHAQILFPRRLMTPLIAPKAPRTLPRVSLVANGLYPN